MKMRYLAVVLMVAVAGCAPRASTSMLDSQTAAISARGGTLNTSGEVTKSMLQEAARQAQQRGFDYFQILQASSGADYVTTGSPTTFVNTGGGTVMALPGPNSTHARPTGSIMVRFYKTRPDAPNVWEAKAVLAAK